MAVSISRSLTFLHGAPQAMEDIYNPYPPARTKLIQDISLAVPAKLTKIWALATSAQDRLQSLQDQVNAAEQKICDAVQPANADVNEASVRKVLYAFDNGLNLLSVCELLVSDNDRDGFNALLANLRLLAKTGKLGYPHELSLDKMIAEAKATIASQSAQLMTRDELIRQAEVEELWNMGRLRQSFKDLFAFFQTQLRPEVIAGQQNRVESVNAWLGLGDEAVNRLRSQGIEWERLPKVPRILLASDIPSPDASTYANAPAPSSWTTNRDSYEVTGVSGGQVQTRSWRDQPLKGALQGDGRF